MFDWVTPSVWRRIVRKTFEADLGLDGVVFALQVWNSHFSDQGDPTVAAREFVRKVTTDLVKPTLRTPLTLKLIAFLRSRNVADLPVDPIPDGFVPAPVTAADVNPFAASSLFNSSGLGPASQPSTQYFAQQVAQVLTSTSSGASPRAQQREAQREPVFAPQPAEPPLSSTVSVLQSFRDYDKPPSLNPEADSFEELMTKLYMSLSTRKMPAAWLGKFARHFLNKPFNASQATDRVNEAYVVIVEQLGPAEADAVLAEAVAAAKSSSKGRVYDPQKFL